MRKSWLGISLLVLLAIFWWGCSDSPTKSGVGRLQLTLVDAPAAVDQVNIYVEQVAVHRGSEDSTSDSVSGWYVVSDAPAAYDLLQLQNGASVLLGDTTLPDGIYTQIRLKLADSCTVVIDGVTYPLDIPSQTGLKLNHPFTISTDQLTALTLDFNADKSIHEYTAGNYRLTPVIRVVSTVLSGSISGTVVPPAAEVTAASLTDTVSTYADSLTGAFKLVALLAGTYSVHIVPADTLYKDTTIADVVVVAKQDTPLGTVNLGLK